MIFNWKWILPGIIALVVAFGTGCSGVNASQGVSPAGLLIPGLMKAEPQVETLDPTLPPPAPPTQVAGL